MICVSINYDIDHKNENKEGALSIKFVFRGKKFIGIACKATIKVRIILGI